MLRSYCPQCGDPKPVPARTRTTCLHLGTPNERRWVSDIITTVGSLDTPPEQREMNITHTRENF